MKEGRAGQLLAQRPESKGGAVSRIPGAAGEPPVGEVLGEDECEARNPSLET